ncbi:hypothetical protein Q7P36_009166 [Cladosporium allicinum]
MTRDSESTPPSSPPVVAARRSKFDDEEDDADVLDSWDAAEDSEVEREKEKKAAEAKAKAEAEAKANHKSKSQRIEEKRLAAMRRKQEEDMEDSDDEETEAEKRARLREEEKLSDLANAEDMFGNIGISDKRGAPKAVTVQESDDPASAVDLSSMKLFKPANPAEWRKLNETLTGLLTQNAKKPQYAIFMQDFAKQLVKDLNSEQVRKIATGLSTMSNEKMKEEKAAEKGGKKSKAAKTKPSVVATKDISSRADTMAYDDGLEDDDFIPQRYMPHRRKNLIKDQQHSKSHDALEHPDLTPRRENTQLAELPTPAAQLPLDNQTLFHQAYQHPFEIISSCVGVQPYETMNAIEGLLVLCEGVAKRRPEVDFCEKSLRGAILLLFVEPGICHDGSDLVLEAFDFLGDVYDGKLESCHIP